MQADVNYLGASIFWSYNVAALVFTAIVLYTIVNLKPKDEKNRRRNGRLTVLFGVLATVSFAVLSANMLHVLIHSFNLWSEQRHAPLDDGILPAIWQWSITSNLFLDFGEAIVAGPRFAWTQTALWITMIVCLYMGYEGKRHRVPRLYAFFALSQILPISFAQNLFYLALIRLPATSVKDVEIRAGASAVVLVVYCGSVAMAPATAGTASLMPLIILARLLLLTPLYLARSWGAGDALPDPRKTVLPGVAALMLGFAAWQAYLIQQQHTYHEIGLALFSHPALSSLGCDALISAVSFVAWTSSLQIETGKPGKSKKLQ